MTLTFPGSGGTAKRSVSLCSNPRTESEGPFTIDYSLTRGLTQHFLALGFLVAVCHLQRLTQHLLRVSVIVYNI